MMIDMWNAPSGFIPIKSAPSSPAKPLGVSRTRSESFHVTHNVPLGDTPYVRAKNVQLMDKDYAERAIPLFWVVINSGDRIDSALKDMAIVMKQQNRVEEAIEAIKSLRHWCSDHAQESLDNILLDLILVSSFYGIFTRNGVVIVQKRSDFEGLELELRKYP